MEAVSSYFIARLPWEQTGIYHYYWSVLEHCLGLVVHSFIPCDLDAEKLHATGGVESVVGLSLGQGPGSCPGPRFAPGPGPASAPGPSSEPGRLAE